MKQIAAHSHIIRANILLVVGVCLGLYFTFHAFYGGRSFDRLDMLQHELVMYEKQRHAVGQEHAKIIEKVTMMRPATLSRDLLEERVRYVLGYKNPQEIVIFGN